MIPRAIYDQRSKGKAYDTYLDLRCELGNYLADRRPTIQVKQSGGDPNAMDIGELQEMNPITKLTQEIEALNAFVKGKGKGKRGEDHGPPGQNDYILGQGPWKEGRRKRQGQGQGQRKERPRVLQLRRSRTPCSFVPDAGWHARNGRRRPQP